MKTTVRLALFLFLLLFFGLGVAQNPCPSPSPGKSGQLETVPVKYDKRRLSPSLGTGGPVGGPTGLFTIYDGQTLGKRSFRFSFAYSNFDRDPGDVDITEVPVSFQYGLTNRLELFFTSNAYRGIKVNSPQNLSSFYLPNAQLHCGGPGVLCIGPAIILAPSGPNVGTLAGRAIFRPLNNQPFVAFPFVGGSAGTFGLGPGPIGGLFGFPGFNALLGPPVPTSGGNFGRADTFPGIGSPVGSILPGIVLATQILPATQLTGAITVPASFTIAPSYLPDAPFINRLYGESSFDTFVIGAKYRLQGYGKKHGVAILPFYRFYRNKANGPGGFNQMQRGAGTGGTVGDFGGFMITEARLGSWVNVSINSGFILNGNPKGTFPSGTFSLLDRPNEVQNGIGIDFSLRHNIQPIFELRSTRYVGNRTPNAFNNNPVEVLAGLKIYSKVYDSGLEFGFGAAYRRHLNQQDRSHFNSQAANTGVTQLSGVNVPGQSVIVVQGTSVPATADGFPLGFRPSSDPNGFAFQFWVGHRHAEPEPSPVPPPDVSVTIRPKVEGESISLSCRIGSRVKEGETCPANKEIGLVASLKDVSSKGLIIRDYIAEWEADPGTAIVEEPAADGTFPIRWIFTEPDAQTTYHVKVRFRHCATKALLMKSGVPVEKIYSVVPKQCSHCLACPSITDLALECPTEVKRDSPVKLSAVAKLKDSDEPDVITTYKWTVSAGTIVGNQAGPQIVLDLTGVSGVVDVAVTAEVSAPGCQPDTRAASCQFPVPREVCTVFDAYRDIQFNDEKARLDNFAIWLNSEPGTTGYYVDYTGSGCSSDFFTDAKRDFRADRSQQYLTLTRGLSSDRLRIIQVPGNRQESYGVILWTCPGNVTPVSDRTDQLIQEELANADCPTANRAASGRLRGLKKIHKRRPNRSKKS